MSIILDQRAPRFTESFWTAAQLTWREFAAHRHLCTDNLEIERHLNATIEWIQVAHTVAGDGGISKGYDLLRARWAPSYPETTGYLIPSLLNVAHALHRPQLQALALSSADYLLKVAVAGAGVGHWRDPFSKPIVFDTGQVMFGWLAALELTGHTPYLEAAVRAGDWLISIQDTSGAWLTHQHLGTPKVIDTRVAWALLALYRHTSKSAYLDAAQRNLEWALKQQNNNGWFQHCTFKAIGDPNTHTLAYTSEGLWECGNLLKEERYILASQRTADALLDHQRPDGALACCYGPDWQGKSRSSCLTGDCQMARLWLRLYSVSGEKRYYNGAKKAILFVASKQNLFIRHPYHYGAISGSSPIYGHYEPFKYPNWSAKFFIDALLSLSEVDNNVNCQNFIG